MPCVLGTLSVKAGGLAFPQQGLWDPWVSGKEPH